ncbi:MAG: hypothetical protein ACRDZQ_16320, partial [Acidimicrobiales bacterium]
MSLSLRLPRRTGGVVTRARGVSIICVGLGLVMVLVFGLGTAAGRVARLELSGVGGPTFAFVPALPVPVRPVSYALGALSIVLGLVGAGRDTSRRASNRILGASIVAFCFSLIAWSAAGKSMSLIGLGQGTMVSSIPLILGALSGILFERSGVINIAIEGQFLVGAFAGALVGSAAANLWLGLA